MVHTFLSSDDQLRVFFHEQGIKIPSSEHLKPKHEALEGYEIYTSYYMDVSENSGTPKWMVSNGKPY